MLFFIFADVSASLGAFVNAVDGINYACNYNSSSVVQTPVAGQQQLKIHSDK